MAYQLIYTSVSRGLIPGRSGYTVAARHRQIRERLVSDIERVSGYTYAKEGTSPVIYTHRKLDLSGVIYHVLTRIVDAGSDYTGRTNHLAHHLICEASELKSCGATPAEILYGFEWLDRYVDEPRYFEDNEIIDLSKYAGQLKLPAANWKSIRGESGDAALLVDGQSKAKSAFVVVSAGEASKQRQMIVLFAESQILLNLGNDAGRGVTFTTYLQQGDSLADFDWVGCEGDNPILQKPTNRDILNLWKLTQPTPRTDAAKIAETGKQIIPPPSVRAVRGMSPSATPLSKASESNVSSNESSRSKQGIEIGQKIIPSGAHIPAPSISKKLRSNVSKVSSISSARGVADEIPFWLRNLKLLIVGLTVVLFAMGLLIFYVNSMHPWQQLQSNVGGYLTERNYAKANQLLDRKLGERPKWREKIADLRKEKIFKQIRDSAETLVNEFDGSSKGELKDLRYNKASDQVSILRSFASNYISSGSSEAEGIHSLMNKFSKLEEAHLASRNVADSNKKPGTVKDSEPSGGLPKVIPKEPIEPSDPEPEPKQYEPGSVYVFLNTGKISQLTLPESLPRLSQGEKGNVMVNLRRSELSELGFPPQLQRNSRKFEYKFPETAEEEEKQLLPLAGGINVELKFQGAGTLQLLKNDSSGSGAEDNVWKVGSSNLMSLGEGREGVQVLLWDGRPFMPENIPFESNGKGILAGKPLKRFVQALNAGRPSLLSPNKAVIRFTPASPPPGLKIPLVSPLIDIPSRKNNAMFIDFGKIAGGGLETVTKIEMQIDERMRVINNSGGDYLKWREKAEPFEKQLRMTAISLLGERNDLLTRYRRIFNHDDPGRVRRDIRNYFMELIIEFVDNLKGIDVDRDDVDKVREELTDNELWEDEWEDQEIDSGDAEAFSEFMENFVEDCQSLAKRRAFGRAKSDFELSYYIESSKARNELNKLARVWEDQFTGDAGEELWEFSSQEKPPEPKNIKLIEKYLQDIDLLQSQKADAEIALQAFVPVEGERLPPGTYDFSFVFSDGEIRPFVISEIERKPTRK